MSIKKVNLAEKFAAIKEHYSPKIAGELNGQEVRLAKLKGPFVRHQHEREDEMFLVVEGKLLMELDDKTLEIEAGEFIIIPRGTFHKPIAPEEVKVMLFEPASTVNTGNAESVMRKDNLDKV